jgi:hypothetical protein
MKLKHLFCRTLEVFKFTALLSLALIMLPLAANANGPGGPEEPKDGCKLLGSWYGYDTDTLNVWWLSTASGQSSSQGTVILEVPGFDATLPVDDIPTFPDVVGMTALRGVWKRTSGNTFEYTVLGIAVDAAGQSHYVGKLTGTETLSEDCGTMFLQETYLQIYLPNMDPFSDNAIAGPIPFPDHYGYRMEVDLPEIILP